MKGKYAIFLKAGVSLFIVWAVVFAVRSVASSQKLTAERVDQEVAAYELEDESQQVAKAAILPAREKAIRKVAEMINKLDFTEREKSQRSRTAEEFFGRLAPKEKELFVELTVIESMGRFMEALDQMPPEQRREFVEKGLEEIRAGRTADELAEVSEIDDELLQKISNEGMRAFFDKASAETKFDLAPLMQAMNEVMQGLRGNEFVPQ